jgi:hypothetical protein
MFLCGPLPFRMTEGLMYVYTFHFKSEHKIRQSYLNLKKAAIQNSSRYALQKVVSIVNFTE